MNNRPQKDLRRLEMEKRGQDWEREEQTALPSRHYDRHYMDDPDRNLQDLMKNDDNRKSKFPTPWEQERIFDKNRRNERGHNSIDKDERYHAYEKDDRIIYEHHRPNSRWDPNSNMPTDPRLDPRIYERKDSYGKYYNKRNEILGQTSSGKTTSSWCEDGRNYQVFKDPLEQRASTSTINVHQPDSNNDPIDTDMRIQRSVLQTSSSGKSKYEAIRPSQSAGPSSLPAAMLQGKLKSDKDLSSSLESQNPHSVTSQLQHSSQKSAVRQPPVRPSPPHSPALPFEMHSSQTGQQRRPPYGSDHFQQQERNVSPHMSPAHLPPPEASFSTPPSGDVDMRIGAPKSVPLNLVTKSDLSLIRKALASLKTVEKTSVYRQANSERPTSHAKSVIVGDTYDPEREWKTSHGTSDHSNTEADPKIIAKCLPQKEKNLKYNLVEQGTVLSGQGNIPEKIGNPPLLSTLSQKPPIKSIPPPLPPDPKPYSLPPPPKPPTLSNVPPLLPSTSHTKPLLPKPITDVLQSMFTTPVSSSISAPVPQLTDSFEKDSVPFINSMPTSSIRSLQHSKSKVKSIPLDSLKEGIDLSLFEKACTSLKRSNEKSLVQKKDSEPAVNNSNKSDMKNTESDKRKPNKSVSTIKNYDSNSAQTSSNTKINVIDSESKDEMLEYLNIGLPASKPAQISQSVKPGSLGDLLLRAKNKVEIKDQPSETVEKAPVRIEHIVSSFKFNDPNTRNNSSIDSNSNNESDRKELSITYNFNLQQYIETNKDKLSEVSKCQPLEILKDLKTSSHLQLPTKTPFPKCVRDQISLNENKEMEKDNKDIHFKHMSSGVTKLDNHSSKGNILEKSLNNDLSGTNNVAKMKSNLNVDSNLNISTIEKYISQDSSHKQKIIPLQKSLGLSQFEKLRLFGHKKYDSPPQEESKTKASEPSSVQDDLTMEPMQIDDDNDTVSQSRDPRMRKKDASISQPQDPRQLMSSGAKTENRDPRIMSQKDTKLDNREPAHDFIPVNDPRRISSTHKDPRKAPNYNNRDPRSQRTDPRLETHTDDKKQHGVLPSSRYETDAVPSHKFTPTVRPPDFDPYLPPPNYNSTMKSHSGSDLRIPPPMPSYATNVVVQPKVNIGMSQHHKGQYMKQPRKFSNPQVRHTYDPAASRSNWPQQQFPITGGVGISGSFFPQRSDVPPPGPPQPPPIYSKVIVPVDSEFSYTCLLMKGLPFFANSRYIYYFFQEFLLLDIVIEVDFKYRCKGNAYIRFSSHQVSKDAFKCLNGWLMNGHQIILKPLTIGFFNQAKITYKAKSLEREASLGLPEMPRGNANPYFKQRPQKTPSPPPTQEPAVSSSKETSLKHHAAYKDPPEKIVKSFKVPKIKKGESSTELITKEKVKNGGSLNKTKEKNSGNKSQKQETSSKELKKKYSKIIIESDSSDTEEEILISENSMIEDETEKEEKMLKGLLQDDSDDTEDQLVIVDELKMKDKCKLKSKVSEAILFEKPMLKLKKNKGKLKESKFSISKKGMQDTSTTENVKKYKNKIDSMDKLHIDSLKNKRKIKASSKEFISDSSSDTDELLEKEKESKYIIKCKSSLNDEVDDAVVDRSNFKGGTEEKIMNILSTTEKEKKKLLHKKSFIIHSKVKRMKQNSMSSNKKSIIKKKKTLLTKSKVPIAVSKLDLSEVFDIVLAPDYIPVNKLMSPVPDEYLKESKITQQHTVSGKSKPEKSSEYIKNIKSVSKKKKKLVKINRKLVTSLNKIKMKSKPTKYLEPEKPKVPQSSWRSQKLTMTEKYGRNKVQVSIPIPQRMVIVLPTADQFIVKMKVDCEDIGSQENVMGSVYINDGSYWSVIDSQRLTMTEEYDRKKVRVTIPTPQRMMIFDNVLKDLNPEKVDCSKSSKSVFTSNQESATVKKTKTMEDFVIDSRRTMTEEYDRKKLRVRIPIPQRIMIELERSDKIATIKMGRTRKVKQEIAAAEVMDLEETSVPDIIDSMEVD